MSLVNSLTDMDQIPPDIVGQLVNSLSNKDALLRQTGLRGIEVLGERVLLPQPGVMAALLVTCNDTNSENNILAKRSVCVYLSTYMYIRVHLFINHSVSSDCGSLQDIQWELSNSEMNSSSS